jgi:hypothetical protein
MRFFLGSMYFPPEKLLSKLDFSVQIRCLLLKNSFTYMITSYETREDSA